MQAEVKMTDLWSAVPDTRGHRVDSSTPFPSFKETRNSGSTIYQSNVFTFYLPDIHITISCIERLGDWRIYIST